MLHGDAKLLLKTVCTVACLTALTSTSYAEGTAKGAPDVLILGDSQLTFGAGEAFLDVLGAMPAVVALSWHDDRGHRRKVQRDHQLDGYKHVGQGGDLRCGPEVERERGRLRHAEPG